MEGIDILWVETLAAVVVAVWDHGWMFETELRNCTKGQTPFQSELVSCIFELYSIYAS